MITLLYVEDHAIVREAIARLIGSYEDMKVLASTTKGEEAVELFRKLRPDVTIVDLQLPGMSGVETIRRIREESPDARVIVLTMYQGDEDIHRALAAGAVSYVLKETATEDLIETIRQVHAGESPILPEVAARLAMRDTSQPLTRRECEVVSLIAAGMRNKEIAAALNLSEETIHSYTKSLFSKLNVNDRSAAVTVALERGIIHLHR